MPMKKRSVYVVKKRKSAEKNWKGSVVKERIRLARHRTNKTVILMEAPLDRFGINIRRYTLANIICVLLELIYILVLLCQCFKRVGSMRI